MYNACIGTLAEVQAPSPLPCRLLNILCPDGMHTTCSIAEAAEAPSPLLMPNPCRLLNMLCPDGIHTTCSIAMVGLLMRNPMHKRLKTGQHALPGARRSTVGDDSTQGLPLTLPWPVRAQAGSGRGGGRGGLLAALAHAAHLRQQLQRSGPAPHPTQTSGSVPAE
jgi:hypothetical protein